MKSCTPAARVMVATSASPAADAAVVAAADEAIDRGMPLEVVHVVPPTTATGPYIAPPDLAMRRDGREVLSRAEDAVESRRPDLEVGSALLVGSRVDALVHHAQSAELLVLGAPRRDLVGHLWTGSTVYGVAARAACPVLVVPAHLSPAASHEVLAALKSTRHSSALLATAFLVAHRRRAALRVVHVWQRSSSHHDAVTPGRSQDAWVEHERTAIEDLIGDLRLAYPDVAARVELIHGQPSFTLSTESKSADLMVISRPEHGGLVHHLGATARGLIRESACPLLVVPPAYDCSPIERPLG
jgi:nucleotide-binding universal stress UspA family protein